jgi:hypothetical protein
MSKVLTDIVSVLVVQKPPIRSKERIQDTHAAVEWQFGYLGSLEFAISIAVFDHKLVVLRIDNVRKNTIIASFLNGVVDGGSFIEMDRLGEDDAGRFLVDIWVQYELSNVGFVAVTLLNEIVSADAESLYEPC